MRRNPEKRGKYANDVSAMAHFVVEPCLTFLQLFRFPFLFIYIGSTRFHILRVHQRPHRLLVAADGSGSLQAVKKSTSNKMLMGNFTPSTHLLITVQLLPLRSASQKKVNIYQIELSGSSHFPVLVASHKCSCTSAPDSYRPPKRVSAFLT